MLQLTDKAAQRLETVLAELDVEEETCFRLGVTREGPKIAIDRERPGDTVLSHDGRVLVVMDAGNASQFDGHTMDFEPAAGQLIVT